MRARIAGILDQLSPAERKVAERVASDPDGVMRSNLAGLARSAGVSEPTAIRFCRSLGLEGFADLRMTLARGEAAAAPPPASHPVTPGMDPSQLPGAVLDAALAALSALRPKLDPSATAAAARALRRASRVEIWGQGAAAALAQDLAHSLFHHCRNVVARSDPQMQALAAAALDDASVVIGLCGTGRQPGLVALARQAAESGATVIALTPVPSPLAEAATWVLPCPASHGPGPQGGLLWRLAMLLQGDALAVSVALLASSPGMPHETAKRETMP